MKTIIHSLLVLALLGIGSCTVEKRLYNKGYHISWNKKFHSGNAKNNIAQAEEFSNLPTGQALAEIPITQTIAPDSPVKKQHVQVQTKENHQKISIFSESKPSISETGKRISKKITTHLQKQAKQIRKLSKSERSNNGRAVLLLVNALIFALLGLVFTSFFGTFGLIFGTIFYIAAGILLIFSIIYFILP